MCDFYEQIYPNQHTSVKKRGKAYDPITGVRTFQTQQDDEKSVFDNTERVQPSSELLD